MTSSVAMAKLLLNHLLTYRPMYRRLSRPVDSGYPFWVTLRYLWGCKEFLHDLGWGAVAES
jgi:hypothetical protein